MRLTFRNRPVVFVDVEASGLDAESYPIEIGWSADDEREPESFLIRPADDWHETDAYSAGFDVHGIPYASLITDGMHLLDLRKRLDAACRAGRNCHPLGFAIVSVMLTSAHERTHRTPF